MTVTAGSDLVLDGAVGGKPEPTVYWSKGDKILELGEKYSLTYTSTRAMAVIKSCDRSDTGRYCLTVKNASGIKTATVNVKVLGELHEAAVKQRWKVNSNALLAVGLILMASDLQTLLGLLLIRW